MSGIAFTNCGACGAHLLPTSNGLCPNCGGSPTARVEVETKIAAKQPPPIAGWLVLPGLGLLFGPFRSVIEIYSTWQLLFSPRLAQTAEGNSSLQSALSGELIMNVLYLGLLLYSAALFFRKKRSAPRAMIILMLAQFAYVLIDNCILCSGLRGTMDVAALGRSLVLCVIWIPYFLVSKRVQNTFIR